METAFKFNNWLAHKCEIYAKWTHWSRRCLEVILQVYFFKFILQIDIWRTSSETGLRWEPQNPNDDRSTLVQVMNGAIKQQAITWTSADQDLCRHKASPGHNGLNKLARHKGNM